MGKILFESLLSASLAEPLPQPDGPEITELAAKINRAARVRLGRSLSIRETGAGSCNGGELEIQACPATSSI